MKLRARNVKQILLLLSAFLLGLIFITFFVSSILDGSFASIFSFAPYEENYDSLCINTEWCNIPIPKKSYFRFPQPPDNLAKWRKAAYAASQGEHILLSKIIKYFPGYHDFLDGDGNFRHYHQLADYFFDHNRHFLGLTDRGMNHLNSLKYSPKTVYPFQKPGNFSVIPRVYDYRQTKRAPIIKLGYHAFIKYQRLTHFFSAETIGEVVIERSTFLKQWKKWSTKILYPFIFLHSSHQNWGFFSTYFPNRSGQWGSCCDNTAEEAETLQRFLDHNKTFLVLVNQHHNLTHPKIITLPRGLPTQKDYNTRKTVRDTMSVLLDQKQGKKKEHFLFATSSNWEFRPNIVDCVSKKFEEEKESKFYQLRTEIPLPDYYFELAQSKFSLALPALGYDTFKIWESLTLGTIPIVEKGVGLDKTLWRLPALLVDDFDEVTPDLLRVAYIEALYRADEFEFERLTQSFWDTFISNVSQSASVSLALQTIFSKFPPESQDSSFTRPLQPFTCGENGELCGVGTKKTPKSTC